MSTNLTDLTSAILSSAISGIKRNEVACLPRGWIREEVPRGRGSKGGTDVFYYSPRGQRVKNKAEMSRILGDDYDLTPFDYQTGQINPLLLLNNVSANGPKLGDVNSQLQAALTAAAAAAAATASNSASSAVNSKSATQMLLAAMSSMAQAPGTFQNEAAVVNALAAAAGVSGIPTNGTKVSAVANNGSHSGLKPVNSGSSRTADQRKKMEQHQQDLHKFLSEGSASNSNGLVHNEVEMDKSGVSLKTPSPALSITMTAQPRDKAGGGCAQPKDVKISLTEDVGDMTQAGHGQRLPTRQTKTAVLATSKSVKIYKTCQDHEQDLTKKRAPAPGDERQDKPCQLMWPRRLLQNSSAKDHRQDNGLSDISTLLLHRSAGEALKPQEVTSIVSLASHLRQTRGMVANSGTDKCPKPLVGQQQLLSSRHKETDGVLSPSRYLSLFDPTQPIDLGQVTNVKDADVDSMQTAIGETRKQLAAALAVLT